MAVGVLVEACHNDDLYMHSIRHLIGFYKKFGFAPIAEWALPPTMRDRYVWVADNMGGAVVQPMRRMAGPRRA